MPINSFPKNDFFPQTPYFLITFHPTTLDSRNDSVAFSNLLSALDSFKEFNLIFTYPNADDGGRKIIERIKDYSIKQISDYTNIYKKK